MSGSTQPHWKGAFYGLGAATLFGLSAPLAKLLLPDTGPLMLAGLLYLGAGIGLAAAWLLPREGPLREARLRREDLHLLLSIVALGGIAGPVLMMSGLGRVSGLVGSLLLNLEGPFTILVAVVFFKEHLGLRGMVAAFLVLAGALFLAYSPGDVQADWFGALAMAGACTAWAIDNNLTQRLSLRDPIAVVRIKALGAGTCMLGLALATGERLPRVATILPSLLVGLVCYGLSIVLDVYALRLLGAAREAAFFASAPFVGAVASIPLLGDRPGPSHILAALLMGTGVFLLFRERHRHLHTHEEVEHDHAHLHDEHHQHKHEGPEPVTEPHAHPHRHVALVHDHPHVPDAHHRHRH